MNGMSVEQLISSLKSPQSVTWAFDEVIERYTERLYWHIRRIVVSHEDAQDALQDSFITAYTNIGSFRGENEGSLTAWLYRIATTTALKVLKRRRRHIFASLDTVSAGLLSDYECEISPDADQIAVKLQRAVVALPMKQKLVFNMRYYDELSFEDISKITGDSVSTLKTNYHYAVKKVKQSVSELEYE